jgi:hypothetical protein
MLMSLLNNPKVEDENDDDDDKEAILPALGFDKALCDGDDDVILFAFAEEDMFSKQ